MLQDPKVLIVVPDVLFNASVQMQATKDFIYALTDAAVGDLGFTAGMAGDDTTAHAFAAVYEPAARTIIEGVSSAGQAIGLTSAKLLTAAIDYTSADDAVAASMMKGIDPSTAAVRSRQPQCDKQQIAQQLPMVTGSKQVHEVPIIGKFWPQGDPDRLYQAADIWLRLADKVDDAQFHTHQHVVPVQANCQGPMIDALSNYVRQIYVPNPAGTSDIAAGRPLMENLSAACRKMSKACTDYATAIHDCRATLVGLAVLAGIITVGGVLLTVFTAGGSDAAAVAADGAIAAEAATAAEALTLAAERALAAAAIEEAEAIVAAELANLARLGVITAGGVLLTAGVANAAPGPNLTGALSMPIPAVGPTMPPIPASGKYASYTPTKASAATAWLAGLQTRDANYGTPDDQAYQIRTAGHPERLMDTGLPPGPGSTVWADGYRAADGAVIDAKHVRDPGCTPRTLQAVEEEQFATKFTLAKDEAELAKYSLVIKNPTNYAQYLEVDTNDPATVPYWEYLAAKNHVPNDVRYIP